MVQHITVKLMGCYQAPADAYYYHYLFEMPSSLILLLFSKEIYLNSIMVSSVADMDNCNAIHCVFMLSG